MMRTLAIDFGSRRVGLAMSDDGARFATPLEVLEIESAEQAMVRVAAIAEEERVERLLVGLPLNMDDTLGPAAQATITWSRRLAGRVGLPLVFVDERLSSFAAEQQLAEMKRSGQKMTRR
ncbi:MAG TPA: Holliday junction resolvase RuvX, partial [Tepidisphaeraceae bacterium]|nr:Holliday junction resolvase RuvX [Tepidisphaeraceae bacterium]